MGSSRSTRNTLRATAGSEIVGSSVGTFFPASVIPIKFTQALGAFGMFFHQSDGSNRDRALLLFQGVLATTQLMLASILFFERTTCDATTKESMCVASFYLMLVYHGTLLTGWGLSEMLRQSPSAPIEGSNAGISGEGSMRSVARIPSSSSSMHEQVSLMRTFAPQNQPPSAQLAGILSPTPIHEEAPDPSVSSRHTVVSMSD